MQNAYNGGSGKPSQAKEDENDNLLIFGYACKLFPHDEKAQFLSEERHLQSWNGDGSLRIDRYDCRLLLTSIEDKLKEGEEEELCPTEEMEEEMCDEERYKDMYVDIQQQAIREAEDKKKRAEVAFDYGAAAASTAKEVNDGSDSEDEPFVPPVGIKLPVGLATPDNLKQSHIIERTALFVVEKGPQMEIVIKAKQRNNTEQFGFLEFDNVLYPYYKYISKMIREKKYTPDFSKKKKEVSVRKNTLPLMCLGGAAREGQPKENRKPSNALAAIAAEHSDSDDDSDSDCELHPSLFAVKKREPSPDIIDRNRNAAGPRQKPAEVEPVVSAIRPDYNIKKSNDVYASLFKSLTGYTDPPPEEKKPTVTVVKKEEPTPQDQSDVDIEWQQWWISFYGFPPPAPAPKPMIPPPPDMEPVVCRYAEFVARHGAQAEFNLVARPDLKLHFMDPESPFFSYYQHKVRYALWEMSRENVQMAPGYQGSPGPSTPEPTPLNRKQRRRLQDAQKVGPAPPPGVVDPLKSNESGSDIHKTQSCPILSVAEPPPPPEPPLKPYVASAGPVSFTFAAPAKEEPKLVKPAICDDDDPLTALIADSPGPSKEGPAEELLDNLITLPPEPPAIQNNQQLDRKEKARIFMEKLLNEKRNAKVREAEESRIRELEQQKRELEKKLAEEEKKEDLGTETKTEENPGSTLDMIDQIINSRIDNLLQSTGIALVQKSPEKKKDEEEDRKRSRESKKHKHKRKRSHSRSHSRDRDRDRERDYRRRRRARSRSSERDSRRNRYR